MGKIKLHILLAVAGLAGATIITSCNDQSQVAETPKQDADLPMEDAEPPKKDDADTATQAESRGAVPAQASCTVDKTEFARWFKGGEITQDGFVTAADSLQLLDKDCDFYQWSWRMFLWQMSREPNGYVFNTPPFFDLNDHDELVANQPGKSGLKRIRGGKRESVDRDGQAGMVSGVLMSQDVGVAPDGSLVYYAIHVNDLYAYMASGVNSKDLTGIDAFPTTAQQRDAIVKYASDTYGVRIDDANTLAMELKSSWVKADPTMDLSKYITIKADIPKYTHESDTKWTWDGESFENNVNLACVGYHLVGSVKGHPEMIWATFEHAGNVPDNNFYYLDSDGSVALQKNWNDDDTPIQHNWLFMDGKSKKGSMNQMRMQLKDGSIVANTDKTIGPDNIMRSHPWGGAPDKGSATNNTAIISINNNITAMLPDGGARQHYMLVGATWTTNGVPGVGLQIPEVVGSITLSNSTMETYFQYKNCFDCHKNGKLNGLSHIFGAIKPLPATSQ